MLNLGHLSVFLLAKAPSVYLQKAKEGNRGLYREDAAQWHWVSQQSSQKQTVILVKIQCSAVTSKATVQGEVGNDWAKLCNVISGQIWWSERHKELTKTFKWVSQPRLSIATFINSIPRKDMSRPDSHWAPCTDTHCILCQWMLTLGLPLPALAIKSVGWGTCNEMKLHSPEGKRKWRAMCQWPSQKTS